MCQQDSFQEHYTQTGRFPGPIVTPPRRPWALINWLFWACLLLYPLGLFLAQLLSSGSMLTIAASVVLCSAGGFFMHSHPKRWSHPETEWNPLKRNPHIRVTSALCLIFLTSTFLSKCSIKQQIWQVKCKSPPFFLETDWWVLGACPLERSGMYSSSLRWCNHSCDTAWHMKFVAEGDMTNTSLLLGILMLSGLVQTLCLWQM